MHLSFSDFSVNAISSGSSMLSHKAEFPSLRLNSVTICIPHILFIHSSDHGCLSFLHVLAITNTSAINMGEFVSFRDPDINSLDKYPEVGFLDHIIALFLIFEEPSYCFP